MITSDTSGLDEGLNAALRAVRTQGCVPPNSYWTSDGRVIQIAAMPSFDQVLCRTWCPTPVAKNALRGILKDVRQAPGVFGGVHAASRMLEAFLFSQGQPLGACVWAAQGVGVSDENAR
jgi:hypothetical protein